MQPDQQNISQQNQRPTAPITNKSEKFLGFRKFHYVFLMMAVVIVPLWLGFGKSILGAHGGWGFFLVLIFLIPFVLIYQVVVLILALMNKQSREKKAVSGIVAWLLTIYYVSLIFYTLESPDVGDRPEQRFNSIFMNVFGNNIGTTLSDFSGIALLIAVICAIAIFIVLLAELVTKKVARNK